jgi:predicted membrane protein
MIHNGAIVGAGIAQGKSITLGIDTNYLRFHVRVTLPHLCCEDFPLLMSRWGLRNSVMIGRNAILSCVVQRRVSQLPLGPLLVAYSSSWKKPRPFGTWHHFHLCDFPVLRWTCAHSYVCVLGVRFRFQSLTWRTFFCAMIATYVLDLMMSGVNEGSGWGELSTNGMFTFGDFSVTGQNNKAWKVTEIPFFLVRWFANCVLPFSAAGSWFHWLLGLRQWFRSSAHSAACLVRCSTGATSACRCTCAHLLQCRALFCFGR